MTTKIKSIGNQLGYDRWSTFYDEYPNPTVVMDERNFPRFWQHLTEKDVLEVGCGTGRHTQKLVARKNRVVGIDLPAGMLAVAQKKMPAVKLIHADFLTDFTLPNAGFDAVIASLVIEHLCDLRTFFRRAAKVLRASGELFLSEIHPLKTAEGGRARFADPETGEMTILESYPHRECDIEIAAKTAGFRIGKKQEVLGEPFLADLNQGWEKYRGMPMLEIWRFVK